MSINVIIIIIIITMNEEGPRLPTHAPFCDFQCFWALLHGLCYEYWVSEFGFIRKYFKNVRLSDKSHLLYTVNICLAPDTTPLVNYQQYRTEIYCKEPSDILLHSFRSTSYVAFMERKLRQFKNGTTSRINWVKIRKTWKIHPQVFIISMHSGA
jgi:hypothetical protein